MEELFVPYEESLTLKELGFNEPCFGYRLDNGDFKMFGTPERDNTNLDFDYYPTAPLYQQAFKWFRDKHDLYHEIHPILDNHLKIKYYRVRINDTTRFEIPARDSYERMELECLRKLIELVKNKN